MCFVFMYIHVFYLHVDSCVLSCCILNMKIDITTPTFGTTLNTLNKLQLVRTICDHNALIDLHCKMWNQENWFWALNVIFENYIVVCCGHKKTLLVLIFRYIYICYYYLMFFYLHCFKSLLSLQSNVNM